MGTLGYIYIYITEIYNMHSNNIQGKINYIIWRSFSSKTIPFYMYNTTEEKPSYTIKVFFSWKSKKSFYFQIQWWIIVHLYNAKTCFYQTKFTSPLRKYFPFNPSIIWDSNVSYCTIICYLTPFLGYFRNIQLVAPVVLFVNETNIIWYETLLRTSLRK
jgi:hypothetical protein